MAFHTIIVPPDTEQIKKAAVLLQAGEVVGIPTETVYGLAADAYNPDAIKKIFLAKGRPQDNPLIVHIDSMEMLPELVVAIPDTARRLAEKFWPGPLTMILPKSDRVPMVTTGNLDTVAIRMPSHPVARQIIHTCGFPLAAPSANLSGSPSPTTAEHVKKDMDGRIPFIINGGECEIGVESTVIAVYDNHVRLLRPGGITVSMLRSCVDNVEIDNGVLHMIANDVQVSSPGMKYKHYAPKAKVIILEGSREEFADYVNNHSSSDEKDIYALLFDGEESLVSIPSLSYGALHDGISQAHGLFASLRKLDDLNARLVYARCPEKNGVGLAVYNRLLRAAGFDVIRLDRQKSEIATRKE